MFYMYRFLPPELCAEFFFKKKTLFFPTHPFFIFRQISKQIVRDLLWFFSLLVSLLLAFFLLSYSLILFFSFLSSQSHF